MKRLSNLTTIRTRRLKKPDGMKVWRCLVTCDIKLESSDKLLYREEITAWKYYLECTWN